MKESQREVVIMALNTKHPAGELSFLHSLGFEAKQVEGVYRGAAEQAFIIICESKDAWLTLSKLGLCFNQESILRVGVDGRATLHYLTTKAIAPLGFLEEVTEGEAIERGGYTYVKASNQYFTTSNHRANKG